MPGCLVAALLLGSCRAAGPVPSTPVGAPDRAAPAQAPQAQAPAGRAEAGPESPQRAEPTIRVGVIVAADSVTVSSPAGLHVLDAATGSQVARLGPDHVLRLSGRAWRLVAAGADIPSLAGLSSASFKSADGAGPVLLDDRPYRGVAEVRVVEDSAVSAINVLPLEDYLLGVVPLEIGPRGPGEFAAVAAQAIAARTYAVSHLGRHREMGFDLFGSVEDQVYGGLSAEREESSRAVRETAGEILTYGGRPIRAMYHSTCGGRTAPIEDVLDREAAPYLRSVPDQAADGTDYCSASPRHRWTVTLSPEELNGRVRRALSERFGVTESEIGRIEGLWPGPRTESGRLKELSFRGSGAQLTVSKLDIRRTLATDEGRILSSTDFEVTPREGGLVELNGRGYGHGAGLCQWGAIGRARAGQAYAEILSAYYPGAELENVY